MTDISVWYKSLPNFTKYWLSLTVGISLLARFGILRGEWLYLEPYFVYHDFQVSDLRGFDKQNAKEFNRLIQTFPFVVLNRYGDW